MATNAADTRRHTHTHTIVVCRHQTPVSLHPAFSAWNGSTVSLQCTVFALFQPPLHNTLYPQSMSMLIKWLMRDDAILSNCNNERHRRSLAAPNCCRKGKRYVNVCPRDDDENDEQDRKSVAKWYDLSNRHVPTSQPFIRFTVYTFCIVRSPPQPTARKFSVLEVDASPFWRWHLPLAIFKIYILWFVRFAQLLYWQIM